MQIRYLRNNLNCWNYQTGLRCLDCNIFCSPVQSQDPNLVRNGCIKNFAWGFWTLDYSFVLRVDDMLRWLCICWVWHQFSCCSAFGPAKVLHLSCFIDLMWREYISLKIVQGQFWTCEYVATVGNLARSPSSWKRSDCLWWDCHCENLAKFLQCQQIRRSERNTWCEFSMILTYITQRLVFMNYYDSSTNLQPQLTQYTSYAHTVDVSDSISNNTELLALIRFLILSRHLASS